MTTPEPAHHQHSRFRLWRIQTIHRMLLDNRYPNCTTLGRALEVTRKTIQRDIDVMRQQMGFQIEWDAHANGYTYTSRDFSATPFLKITEGEALALFVSQQALAQYRGTPFEKPLESAFRHLAEQLNDLVTFSPRDLTRYVTFAHTGQAITALEIYDGIMGALLDEKTVTFQYRKLDSLRAEQRTVQPWHLACINQQWYLFAYDLKRRAVRTFVLGRILKILDYGKPFQRPADFSPARLLADSFGIFHGEGDFRIVLEFDPFGAQLVRERQWHASQEIEEKADGGLVLCLQLGALEEVERWILSFGRHVRVHEPSELVQRVRDNATQLARHLRLPGWFEDLQQEVKPRSTGSLQELLLNLAFEHPSQLDLPFEQKIER